MRLKEGEGATELLNGSQAAAASKVSCAALHIRMIDRKSAAGPACHWAILYWWINQRLRSTGGGCGGDCEPATGERGRWGLGV